MGKTYLQGDTLSAADLNASLQEAVNTNGYFVFSGVVGSPLLPYVDPVSGLTVTPNPMTGQHVHNARLTANAVFEVNTSPSYFYTQLNVSGADIRVSQGGGVNVVGTGNIATSGGIVSDKLGNVRSVPPVSVNTPYGLAATDAGKFIYMTGGALTVPNATFSAGDTVTIYNYSTTASMTITPATGLTMYWAGQSTASAGARTLGLTGLCTIAFITASYAVIAGNGLS